MYKMQRHTHTHTLSLRHLSLSFLSQKSIIFIQA